MKRKQFSSIEKNPYANALNALSIRPDQDPFPLSAPSVVKYWADNKEIRKKVIQSGIDSMMFSSTSFYIYEGPLGTGKTFAASYLTNYIMTKKVSEKVLSGTNFNPFVISITSGISKKTGELIFGIHTKLVTFIFNEIIEDPDLLNELNTAYENIPNGNIRTAFKNLKKDLINTIDRKTTIRPKSEFFKYLNLERNKIGNVDNNPDLILILKTLVDILLIKYNKIIVIIDELENLKHTTILERRLFNDYFRILHDQIDQGLTVIMIFTFNTVADKNGILDLALEDRIKTIIEFKLIQNESDLQEYIADSFKKRSKVDIDMILEKESLEYLTKELFTKIKYASFRKINNEMHKIISDLFVIQKFPKKFFITKSDLEKYWQRNAEEIINNIDELNE